MKGEEQRSGDTYDRVYSLNYPQHIARLILSLDIESMVSRITIPTLLIYGAKDKIVSFAQGQRLVQSMAHARCLQIPGATHYTTPLDAQSLRESTGWLLGARTIREG
jgi:pimeloyl-ACP methyl ester carboxylesterase